MDDVSFFHCTKNEAKISLIRALPSCAFDIIWSQRLHHSGDGAAVLSYHPYTYPSQSQAESQPRRQSPVQKNEANAEVTQTCILLTDQQGANPMVAKANPFV